MATHVRHFFVMWLVAGDACAAVSNWTGSRLVGSGSTNADTLEVPRPGWATYACTERYFT